MNKEFLDLIDILDRHLIRWSWIDNCIMVNLNYEYNKIMEIRKELIVFKTIIGFKEDSYLIFKEIEVKQ